MKLVNDNPRPVPDPGSNWTDSEDRDICYWREVDNFFRLEADEKTIRHVLQVYGHAYTLWIMHHESGERDPDWVTKLARPELESAMGFVILNQRRLTEHYYGEDQDALFNSIWQCAADTFRDDPLAGTDTHTIADTMDWLYWIPCLDVSLQQGEVNPFDLMLARAWQVGLASEAFNRKRGDPVRIQESEFDDYPGSTLQERVHGKYATSTATELMEFMRARLADIPNS